MQSRIIKRTVDALGPGARDFFVWDDAVKGFGLKVTPAGRKVYVFQYRMAGRESVTRRYTIGEHGTWTPDKARDRAEALGRMVAENIDPLKQEQDARLAEKAQALETERGTERRFSVFAERFIARRLTGLDSAMLKESIIRRRFMTAWGSRDLAEITREDVGAVLDRIVDEGKPSAAWNALRTIRPLFAYAVERGLIEANPASRIRPDVSESSRDRVLKDEELALVWRAAGELAYPFGSMVRLLILTGQRRDEVAGMQWGEVDLAAGLWSIPAARTKSDRAHIVHLGTLAVGLLTQLPRLSDTYVLTTTGSTPVSGFSKAKIRLDQEILKLAPDTFFPGWTLHDLRRTLATGLADMGVLPHIAEKVLNHNPKALSGVAGIYNRHEYLAERKAALDAWDGRVASIVGLTQEVGH